MPNPSTRRISETHTATEKAYRELMEVHARVAAKLATKETTLEEMRIEATLLRFAFRGLAQAAATATVACYNFAAQADKALYPSKEVGDE